MTLHSVAKTAEKFVTDNSPAILTAIGVTGTLTTAYLAGKASFKAAEVISQHKTTNKLKDITGETHTEFGSKEQFQLVWQLYIPAGGMALTTIACIIAANRIGNRRAAAMAAAYTLSEKAFAEYKEKVIEKIGQNKEREVRDEVAQDRVRANPPGKTEIIIARGGDVLFLDAHSGRYFTSDMESVKKAQNDLNYMVNNNFYASLNDFYDKIGLDRIPMGEEVGWNCDELLELEFSTTVSDDNRPCFVLTFKVAPIRNYYRVH